MKHWSVNTMTGLIEHDMIALVGSPRNHGISQTSVLKV